jgi:beta-mannosidase
MMTPLASRAISSHSVVALDSGWQLADSTPGNTTIDQIDNLQWRDAIVPGTVAQSIHEDINVPGYYDRRDWWYRTSFTAPQNLNSATRRRLRFEGLATLADIWLNGEKILSTDNMFCTDVIDVTEHLREHNNLVIHFHSHATSENE